MKIHDISQEVFSCQVYPGDQAPRRLENMRMSRGDLYNLTSLEMCTHNGTHIDLPFHFFEDGETAEQLPLEKVVGFCYVSLQSHDIDSSAAKQIINAAKQAQPDAAKRILIKGQGTVTEEAARVFAAEKLFLLGVESQTVGPDAAPMAVHKILLQAKAVLLEGIRLTGLKDGVYFLSAAPLSLMGSDGAPCRAILIEEE